MCVDVFRNGLGWMCLVWVGVCVCVCVGGVTDEFLRMKVFNDASYFVSWLCLNTYSMLVVFGTVVYNQCMCWYLNGSMLVLLGLMCVWWGEGVNVTLGWGVCVGYELWMCKNVWVFGEDGGVMRGWILENGNIAWCFLFCELFAFE